VVSLPLVQADGNSNSRCTQVTGEDTTTTDGHLQALRVEAAEEIIGVRVGEYDARDSIQTIR
jgi:hypothetical protein